jgi:hypothetical protein
MKLLEDHPHCLALAGDLMVGKGEQTVSVTTVSGDLSINRDVAGIDLLELVYAAQEGAFSGAGWPDDADDLTLLDLELDIPQNMKVTEIFL